MGPVLTSNGELVGTFVLRAFQSTRFVDPNRTRGAPVTTPVTVKLKARVASRRGLLRNRSVTVTVTGGLVPSCPESSVIRAVIVCCPAGTAVQSNEYPFGQRNRSDGLGMKLAFARPIKFVPL